jgi:adenosine deaminase
MSDIAENRLCLRVRAACAELPKTELHLHLDGSLSQAFIKRRSAARNIALCTDGTDVRSMLVAQKSLRIASGSHVQRAGGNWNAFDFCNRFLQTVDELSDATAELARSLHIQHNVWVCEIRFCPALHTLEALNEEMAVAAVVSGFERACADCPNLRGGIILCASRSFPESHFVETFSIARRWLGRGVVGGDIAGDERSFPILPFVPALQDAVRAGLPMTCHAGEYVPQSDANVLSCVEDIGAQRLGHGLILGSSETAMAAVVNAGTPVEVCLTSNIGGGAAKCLSYATHPVKKMIAAGVRIAGFNSDNLLLSGTLENIPTPTAELWRAVLECDIAMDVIPSVLLTAFDASFDPRLRGDEEYRRAYIEQIDSVLAKYRFI